MGPSGRASGTHARSVGIPAPRSGSRSPTGAPDCAARRATRSCRSTTARSRTRCSTSWSPTAASATATEVTLRVGAATGDRLALITPDREGVRLPDDVRVVGADELATGTRAWIHEVVGGPALADLGRLVLPDPTRRRGGVGRRRDRAGRRRARAAARDDDGSPRTLLDAYGGVGLFAGGAPRWTAAGGGRSRSRATGRRPPTPA